MSPATPAAPIPGEQPPRGALSTSFMSNNQCDVSGLMYVLFAASPQRPRSATLGLNERSTKRRRIDEERVGRVPA